MIGKLIFEYNIEIIINKQFLLKIIDKYIFIGIILEWLGFRVE